MASVAVLLVVVLLSRLPRRPRSPTTSPPPALERDDTPRPRRAKVQPPTAAELGHPDPARGAVIAAQGNRAGAFACAQCHAFNGVSDATGAFPRIAGQSREYLARQLRDYSSGVRSNALMSPIAEALEDQEIADVSAYYAAVDGPLLPLKRPDPALVEVGEKLATVGDARGQIQACNNCHGPGGVGLPSAIPYIGGQYAHYIEFTLREWQQGLRKGSRTQMVVVAQHLDWQQIAAVAAYYQQARSPRGTDTAGPGEKVDAPR